MKKGMILLLVVGLLLMFAPAAMADEDGIRIYLNEVELLIAPELGKPFIDANARTQIPVRAISEGLGKQVDWDPVTRKVTIFQEDGTQVHITIGSAIVHTPTGDVTMDTQAVIINGRTYLPLRFASEALGYVVNYRWENGHRIDIQKTITEIDFTRPNAEQLPGPIAAWVENSKVVPVVQERVHEGLRYVLITEGEKPTGGYHVEVLEANLVAGQIVLTIERTEPGPDDVVTQALTYPYDLIVLEDTERSLAFVDVDDAERYFLNLFGMNYIEAPVVAASPWIKIFAPAPDAVISDTIVVEGIANVYEGTVSYGVLNNDEESLYEGFVTAAQGDWMAFSFEIEIDPAWGSEVLLELYSESMEDGSKMFRVEIPLMLAD